LTNSELKFIAVGDPAHFAQLISASLEQRGIITTNSKVVAKLTATLTQQLTTWSAAHGAQFTWAKYAGRKSKGKDYRIAFQGKGQTELLDSLDAEIRQLVANSNPST
jgi:hypothetical protein